MNYVEVPLNKLNKDTLFRFIEEFVSREGTDYGHVNISFSDKVQSVYHKLQNGEAFVSYDLDTQTTTIVPRH